ncbi:MAG TPA: sugar phosphate isomerase/epimerase [Oscillospiraceae bacterium]|nr:sugar phosphate isomerase/epimerase [Oscillospiraceae bacterium]
MALGLTSVTFRNLSADEIIDLAFSAGCEVIEWGGDIHVTNKKEAKEVYEKCSDKGIRINSYGSYYRLLENKQTEFERLCEIASVQGAKIIRVWLGDKGSKFTTKECFEKLSNEAEKIAAVADEYNLIVASEFHNGTYNDTAKSAIHFLEHTACKNLKTYWQPMFSGKDIENLNRVVSETVVVHLFNWNKIGVRYSLKSGETKIREFLDILQNKDYKGDIILEFVKGDKPVNFLEDFNNLKQWYYKN